MGAAPLRTLFVTWDGPDQPYLDALYLPILRRAQQLEPSVSFAVLQFGWDSADRASARGSDSRQGFRFRRVRVLLPSTVPGVAATVALGSRRLLATIREWSIDVVLARSLFPIAIALLAGYRHAWGLCFDVDGLMVDERIDFAGWRPMSPVCLGLRTAELAGLVRADSVVTRTYRCRELLRARAGSGYATDRWFVVPNGKDPSEFCSASPAERARVREAWGVGVSAPWLVSVGSLGPQYYPEATLELHRAVQRRCADARMLWLANQPTPARALVESLRVPGCTVARVPPEDVAAILGAADVGIALRAPVYSQLGVSPVKVAEYLLSGLGVVATRGVGDLDTQIGDCEAVRLVTGPEPGELASTADWILSDVIGRRETMRERARTCGIAEFNLDDCARGYLRALRAASR